VYRTFWERENWDVFMIVFTGTDRLGHYFQDDWEEKKAPFYESFLEYYTRIDEQIGWIADHKKENDILMMMSDHGMESIQSEVYLNTFLEREGFLQITKGERINYNNLTSRTKALVLEPSRIYLNYSSRYPQGSVKQDDREAIIKDLISLFNEFSYQDKAEKIVDRVVRKEEIYTGDQMDNAPDLILVPGKGFSLRGTLGKDQVFGLSSTIKGMHRGDDAFLYVHGPNAGSLLPEVPRTEDVLTIATKCKES
ncbi:MAG: alkaline phosphatase family protein, partial [bacterium]